MGMMEKRFKKNGRCGSQYETGDRDGMEDIEINA